MQRGSHHESKISVYFKFKRVRIRFPDEIWTFELSTNKITPTISIIRNAPVRDVNRNVFVFGAKGAGDYITITISNYH